MLAKNAMHHHAYLRMVDQIIKKLRRWIDAGHKQMITSSGAGDIEQVTLGVVDLLKVRIIGYGFDTFLERHDFVIAGHHRDSSELKPLSQVHGADRNVPRRRFHLVAELAGLGS